MTDGIGLERGLGELAELARAVSVACHEAITDYAVRALATIDAGGKILFCGNGGSAADAQHLAAEYVVRLSRDRQAMPALALTTDTSILTACANDRGYREVFARQVEAVGAPGDLLVLHSTSGQSDNLLVAVTRARAAGLSTVGVLARGGGRLRSLVDVAVVVPTDRASRAQEIHLAIGHIVCAHVEESLFGGLPARAPRARSRTSSKDRGGGIRGARARE
ncbi:MAG: SIS domain-containing protein [Gemmatimonadetes bacterium]|nr:SIS domain-containing protein [Gemmatimonadota bacterium]